MTEIAGDLKARFDSAVLWFHEKCELDANSLLDEHATVDLTDDEANRQRASVDGCRPIHRFAARQLI